METWTYVCQADPASGATIDLLTSSTQTDSATPAEQTIYSFSPSGDLLSQEQEVNGPRAGGAANEDNESQNTAYGGDPVTSYVYTALGNAAGCPAGLVSSVTDPDGDVTAYSYNARGDVTATAQGQTIASVAGTPGYYLSGTTSTWTFSNLAPNRGRTFNVYAFDPTTSTADYSVSNAQVGMGGAADPAASVLGDDWVLLEAVVLNSDCTTLTVNYSGSAPADVPYRQRLSLCKVEAVA